MKSDIIEIDNLGHGYDTAMDETRKVCSYTNLCHKDALRLQLCAEELLSMARSVTGEIQASFWVEREGKKYELHIATKTIMDREKRAMLMDVATSKKNEAASSFIGKLRDMFESAMDAEASHQDGLPDDVMDDLVNRTIQCSDPEWDGYEHSTLKRLADVIRIGIRRGNVEITVIKTFD